LEIIMLRPGVDNDAAQALIERRWFAAITAVRTLQAECDVLREAMERAEGAWRHAHSRLVRLEALRDALGEELAERDGRQQGGAPDRIRPVSSAA
jgi:hypothetical protein